jgi:hypothetical protein
MREWGGSHVRTGVGKVRLGTSALSNTPDLINLNQQQRDGVHGTPCDQFGGEQRLDM